MQKAIQLLVVIVICLVAGIFVWWFYGNFQSADANIRVALIGLSGVALAGILSHRQTRRREILARHFTEKREGFMHIIDLIFEMVEKVKKGEVMDEEEMVPKMMDFKKALMIWGSADLIAIWNEYEVEAAKQDGTANVLLSWEKILRGIRKDLGHNDLTLKSGGLVGLILVAEDKNLVAGL